MGRDSTAIHAAPEDVTGCAMTAVSMERVYHQGSGSGGSMRHLPIDKPKDFYRVFAPGVPNVSVLSERLSEADARSRKREILMTYPAATVRIEKTGESGRNSRTPE